VGCQQVGVPVDLLTAEFNESLVFDQMFGARGTHALSITEQGSCQDSKIKPAGEGYSLSIQRRAASYTLLPPVAQGLPHLLDASHRHP
jgi:hypothetical protein